MSSWLNDPLISSALKMEEYEVTSPEAVRSTHGLPQKIVIAAILLAI
jgi:hypothetical protein